MNRFFKDLVGVVEQAAVEKITGSLGSVIRLVIRDQEGFIKFLITPSLHIDVHENDSHDDIKTKLLNAMHEDIPHNANKE